MLCDNFFATDSDQEHPSITCPLDILSSSDRVSWAKPAVIDNVDTSLEVACVPESGSLFRAGETRVTCSVTDSHGNTGSCLFSVVVGMYYGVVVSVAIVVVGATVVVDDDSVVYTFYVFFTGNDIFISLLL